jgi:hypothetical protein
VIVASFSNLPTVPLTLAWLSAVASALNNTAVAEVTLRVRVYAHQADVTDFEGETYVEALGEVISTATWTVEDQVAFDTSALTALVDLSTELGSSCTLLIDVYHETPTDDGITSCAVTDDDLLLKQSADNTDYPFYIEVSCPFAPARSDNTFQQVAVIKARWTT